MAEKKSALIIANSQYEDSILRQLVAPAQDAEALARVLADPGISGFEVSTILDEPRYRVEEEIDAFFIDRDRDDLLLVYFSGHGVTDEDGLLYYAARNTQHKRLRSTAVAASFVNESMVRCRSRRQVLLLDCCHSGAFARAKAAAAVNAGEQFAGRTAEEGRGRFVLTASDAYQYSFEGDAVEGQPVYSVFTQALTEGLRTGEADIDGDGLITLDELYSYVHRRVKEHNPRQSPRKWVSDVEGGLVIGLNPCPSEAPLPDDLQHAIENLMPEARERAIPRLEKLLTGKHRGLALASHRALLLLAEDDSRRVSTLAKKSLEALEEPRAAFPLTVPVVASPTEATPRPAAEAPRHVQEEPKRPPPTAAVTLEPQKPPQDQPPQPSSVESSPSMAAPSPITAAMQATSPAAPPQDTPARESVLPRQETITPLTVPLPVAEPPEIASLISAGSALIFGCTKAAAIASLIAGVSWTAATMIMTESYYLKVQVDVQSPLWHGATYLLFFLIGGLGCALALPYATRTSYSKAILFGAVWALTETAVIWLNIFRPGPPGLSVWLSAGVVGLAAGLVSRKLDSRLTIVHIVVISFAWVCVAWAAAFLLQVREGWYDLADTLRFILRYTLVTTTLQAALIFGPLSYHARLSTSDARPADLVSTATIRAIALAAIGCGVTFLLSMSMLYYLGNHFAIPAVLLMSAGLFVSGALALKQLQPGRSRSSLAIFGIAWTFALLIFAILTYNLYVGLFVRNLLLIAASGAVLSIAVMRSVVPRMKAFSVTEALLVGTIWTLGWALAWGFTAVTFLNFPCTSDLMDAANDYISALQSSFASSYLLSNCGPGFLVSTFSAATALGLFSAAPIFWKLSRGTNTTS
jgi:hypothetical protein